MVYNGKSYYNGEFGGTLILENHQLKPETDDATADVAVTNWKVHVSSSPKCRYFLQGNVDRQRAGF